MLKYIKGKIEMLDITTEKHGNGSLTNYEICVNGEYFGTWFGHREEDAIDFAKRNYVEADLKRKDNYD